MNLKKIIKDSSISISITIFILLLVEFFITYMLGYRNFTVGNKKCKFFNDKENFSSYKPNCKLIDKNWENNIKVEYYFNSFGRRDGELNSNYSDAVSIASIGDSFTFGAMVPINDNYNYYGFRNDKENKYAVHNYGVSGEQLDNIVNKLVYKKLLFSEYDFILYGLTPNDLFDYLEGSKSEINLIEDSSINLRFIKSIILSSSISRFLIHNILSNDSNYYSIYLKRKPYSGYLNPKLDKNWEYALEIFESKISNLPVSLKSKLKIILLPQRAEVVGYRLGSYNGSFSNRFIKSCEKVKVDCFNVNLKKLSLLEESHFPVDGHITIEGNRLIGKELNSWSKTWKTKK